MMDISAIGPKKLNLHIKTHKLMDILWARTGTIGQIAVEPTTFIATREVEFYLENIRPARYLNKVYRSLLLASYDHRVCEAQYSIPPCRYKAVGEVNAPPSLTFDYAVPGAIRTKWDKSVKV